MHAHSPSSLCRLHDCHDFMATLLTFTTFTSMTFPLHRLHRLQSLHHVTTQGRQNLQSWPCSGGLQRNRCVHPSLQSAEACSTARTAPRRAYTRLRQDSRCDCATRRRCHTRCSSVLPRIAVWPIAHAFLHSCPPPCVWQMALLPFAVAAYVHV